jgi:hypothetical protein
MLRESRQCHGDLIERRFERAGVVGRRGETGEHGPLEHRAEGGHSRTSASITAGDWAVRYAAHEDPGFGLVLEGKAMLAVDGVGAVALAEGDFVSLPATPGFTRASDVRVRPTHAVPEHTGELRHGAKSGPPTLRMLGGYFRFDRANAQLVLRLLPVMVLVRRDDPVAERLRQTAQLIGEETRMAGWSRCGLSRCC